MDRDEFERLKNEEKAHLRKVRALKQQLREATRKKGLLNALKGLDTSSLDGTHEEMLRKLTEKNITSEARFELAMDTLDDAAKQEAAREEMARLEAERQKSDAADLVRQMKAQMLGDAVDHVEAAQQDEGDAQSAELESSAPAKTIGAASAASDDPEDTDREGEPPPSEPNASHSDDTPARTIGRFGPSRGRDTERD